MLGGATRRDRPARRLRQQQQAGRATLRHCAVKEARKIQKKKKTRRVLVATSSSSSTTDLDDDIASISVVSSRSSTSRPWRGKQPNLSFNGKEYQVFRLLCLTAAENQGDKEKFQTLLNALKGPAKSDDADRQKHSNIQGTATCVG